jgi:protein-S-isoprenylcysteine O-methyltransferase Ste14
MLLVLLQTAIFTAIVLYAVGLWLPTQVPSAFSESTIGIEPERWKIILSLPLLFAGALALCFSGRSLLFFIWCLLPRAFNCSSCGMRKIFGEQYQEDCRRVPRWIPRLRATP